VDARAALPTRHENRAHAEPAGTLDVVLQTVADHDGLVRLGSDLAQRRLKNAGCGFM
jgi:hypothetical protein